MAPGARARFKSKSAKSACSSSAIRPNRVTPPLRRPKMPCARRWNQRSPTMAIRSTMLPFRSSSNRLRLRKLRQPLPKPPRPSRPLASPRPSASPRRRPRQLLSPNRQPSKLSQSLMRSRRQMRRLRLRPSPTALSLPGHKPPSLSRRKFPRVQYRPGNRLPSLLSHLPSRPMRRRCVPASPCVAGRYRPPPRRRLRLS